MWWEYALVFLGAIIMDVTPLPLPPAFSVMIFFQVVFGLDIWPVIFLGVAGSAIGRLILAAYIPVLAGRLLSAEKNSDIRLLGELLKSNRLKGQLFILLYTLMPLPSTPLFIAGGIARLRPLFILPAFIVGKFTSDTIAVFMGAYATANAEKLFAGNISFHSILALSLFFFLMFLLLFVNWRSVLYHKRIRFKFNIWSRRKVEKEVTAN